MSASASLGSSPAQPGKIPPPPAANAAQPTKQRSKSVEETDSKTQEAAKIKPKETNPSAAGNSLTKKKITAEEVEAMTSDQVSSLTFEEWETAAECLIKSIDESLDKTKKDSTQT